MICGLPDIDIKDWKANSEYVDSATLPSFSGMDYDSSKHKAMSTVLLWFWKAVESFNNEQRAKLLQFVTGTTKVPLGGKCWGFTILSYPILYYILHKTPSNMLG